MTAHVVSEWRRSPYLISTDPSRIDFATVHDFLTVSYWSPGITREAVERAAAHSMPFGLFHHATEEEAMSQVGYARVVTDRVRFAYVLDVFVVKGHRGRGLGQWLMETILDHPELRRVGGWLLKTRDAHGLYQRLGFAALRDPELYMRRGGAAIGEGGR